MKVTMNKEAIYYLDGMIPSIFEEGEEYDVPAKVGQYFMSKGFVKQKKDEEPTIRKYVRKEK